MSIFSPTALPENAYFKDDFGFFFLSDKKSGTLVLVCELMDMNIYELIRGECSLSIGDFCLEQFLLLKVLVLFVQILLSLDKVLANRAKLK